MGDFESMTHNQQEVAVQEQTETDKQNFVLSPNTRQWRTNVNNALVFFTLSDVWMQRARRYVLLPCRHHNMQQTYVYLGADLIGPFRTQMCLLFVRTIIFFGICTYLHGMERQCQTWWNYAQSGLLAVSQSTLQQLHRLMRQFNAKVLPRRRKYARQQQELDDTNVDGLSRILPPPDN